MNVPDPLSARSKVLFGNRHMLTVCGWVLSHTGMFCNADAVAGTNVSSTNVHRTLSVLTQFGFLSRVPRDAAGRTQWYERIDGSFWVTVGELVSGVPASAALK